MRVLLALLLSALAGCTPRHAHHTLTAPPATAAEAERTAAYERLFSRGAAGTLVVASEQVTASSTDYLVLGDGTRVHHVEDLLMVVPTDSPTARAALRGKEAARRANAWTKATGAAFVATLVIPFGGPYVIYDRPTDGVQFALITGLIGITVTGLFIWQGAVATAEADDERVSAFATYNTDLRKALDLCVEGTRVIACEAAPAQPAVPAQPVPAPAQPAPAPAPAQPAVPPAPAPPAAPQAPAPTPTPTPPAPVPAPPATPPTL